MFLCTHSGCPEEEIAATAGQLFQWYSHKKPWYPWRKQTEGRPGPPPRSAEEDEWWGSCSWGYPAPEKGKDGFCYSTRYQQSSATGKKRQPWSEHKLSDVERSAGNGCFSPKSPLAEQGGAGSAGLALPQPKELLEHQASPQPAVSGHIMKAENTTKPSFSANHSLIFLFVQ